MKDNPLLIDYYSIQHSIIQLPEFKTIIDYSTTFIVSFLTNINTIFNNTKTMNCIS